MELGMIGLGRMGANMTERLVRGGHRVIGYARNPETVAHVVKKGAVGADSLVSLVNQLSASRVIWLMVPSGDPVDQTIEMLAPMLNQGDTIIDGGNSHYKDSIRRYKTLKEKKINFVDVGTSGGVWGLTEGYSLMVGGEASVVKKLYPIFQTLAPAPNKGWGHVGPNGAGHFTKMVHNGIEYGLMQAYAEGFEIMKAKKEFELNLHQIAELWRYGSVVRSWLLDLTAAALKEDQELTTIKGWVADSGEGRWAIAESIDLDVPAPVISLSLWMRFVSRQDESYAAKLLAAMRHQFGGHAIKTK
jgi:6-phosphogluconate dehydrogenase